MAMIELPKEFHPDFTSPGVKPTGPVEIDWANPLSRGTTTLLPIQSAGAGNKERDLVNGFTGAFGANITRELGYIDKSSTGTTGADLKEYSLNDFTVSFAAKKIDTVNSSNGILFGKSTTNRFWLYKDTDFYFTANNSTVAWSGCPNFRDKVRFYTITRKGTTIELFIDGVSQGTKTNGNAFTYNRLFDPYGNFNWQGELHYLHIVGRHVTSGVASRIHQDPYQILKPSVPVFLSVGGGGSTTATVTGSLTAILQKQGIAKQTTLSAILQKQGLSLNSSVDALLQKAVTITNEIDAVLQKLGITSATSIEALLEKRMSVGTSIDAVLATLIGGSQSTSIDAILKKNGVTGVTSLDSILQKRGDVSTTLSSLLQKTVSLSSIIDAVLQKSVTTGVSIDAILAQAGSGILSTSLEAILRKTVAVNLSVDALLQRQDLTGYVSLSALLEKKVTKTINIDAILYSVASVAVSLDALLKKTGLTITTNLDAILGSSKAFIIPKNLVCVLNEDRVVTVLTEDRVIKVV